MPEPSTPLEVRPSRLELLAVSGIGELRPGDDLAAIIADAAPWIADGDVLAVTSKVVSKVEGRLVRTDPDPELRDQEREKAIDGETVAVVAVRGRTRIVRTRQGLVLAAAGIDASNVRPDELALLPARPDDSAARLREQLRERLGVDVAVVITDTAGRAWRHGLVDIAIGVAGMSAIRDLRGDVDSFGTELAVTEMADADAVATASELLRGKLAATPVVVVRGLPHGDDGRGSAPLLRPEADDMFRLGARDVVGARRDVTRYADTPVDPTAVEAAVGAALTAPLPDAGAQYRFVHVTGAQRARLAQLPAAVPAVVAGAPDLLLPCLVADDPPDPATLLAAGAAIQALLVQLAAEGLGSVWAFGSDGDPAALHAALQLPTQWQPLGVVGLGHPATPSGAGVPQDPGEHLVRR